MNRIIPSIASADPIRIETELNRISESSECHLDIEDGNFIPNITFGMKTVKAIASVWQGKLDAHLFTTNPGSYIKKLADCGVDSISFHVETESYPLELLRFIQSYGIKAGFAFNPGTPLEPFSYMLPMADYLLLMSSEPDGKGQEFLPHTFERVKYLRQVLDRNVEIWVDGGIDKEKAIQLCAHGANVLIMGRSVFDAVEAASYIRDVTDAINKG